MEAKQTEEAAVLAMCNILKSVEERLRSVRYHLDPTHDGKGLTTEAQRDWARYLANAVLDRLLGYINPALRDAGREVLTEARKDARCV